MAGSHSRTYKLAHRLGGLTAGSCLWCGLARFYCTIHTTGRRELPVVRQVEPGIASVRMDAAEAVHLKSVGGVPELVASDDKGFIDALDSSAYAAQ
jgi:hypothetical protein